MVVSALLGGVALAALIATACTPAKSTVDLGPDDTASTDDNSGGSTPSAAPTGANAEMPEPVQKVDELSDLLAPKLSWGMKISEVVDVYNGNDGIFDSVFAPVLAKMQPGTRMQMVESDLNSRKSSFVRNLVHFQDDPTGFDQTGIKGEFTYKNAESMQWANRFGMKQYFFYFGDTGSESLWKVYDELPLRDGGPIGATYQEAVTNLTALLGGTAGSAIDGGTDGFPTLHWAGSKNNIRAIDRSGEHMIGIVFEDTSTLSRLDALRPNKESDPFAIDSNTAAVTKHGVTNPNAPRPTPDASAPKH